MGALKYHHKIYCTGPWHTLFYFRRLLLEPVLEFLVGLKTKLFGPWNCLPAPVCVRLVQGPVTVELGDLIASISCQRVRLVNN
jgi:hypothetical protein